MRSFQSANELSPITDMKWNTNTLLIIILMVFGIQRVGAQKNVHEIEILNADIIKTDKSLAPGAQKLLGNVRFKHEDAFMFCDSAYFYSKTYSMDAFSNVRIEQGDTLFLYGDKLHYEGETRIAQVRENVKLLDDSTVLITEHLDYNRETGIAHYLDGGIITEGENQLTSEQGYYFTDTEIFDFKDSVIIVNPDYTIYSDTLEYDTKTQIAYFFGPTEIIGEDNYLYCEGGWYNTDADISLLNKNACLKREGRRLLADTLYYERESGFGRARSDVELFDSAQNVYLKGNFGLYYELEQLATLTDSALMIQINGADSLYIHADTLRSIKDTASLNDEKILLAFYHVKLFREDLQGMCDSMAYIEKDSTFHMFGTPLLWTGENQIAASKIEVEIRDQQIHRLYLKDIALLCSKKDSVKFNQIRGKSMTGYFIDNDLVRLDVTGNGQSVYYVEDEGIIIGANRIECSDFIIYLKDNKVQKVNPLVQPTGIYYPLDLFTENLRYLNDFSWNEEWRPKKWTDIFFWK